jgi:hypothetical protein
MDSVKDILLSYFKGFDLSKSNELFGHIELMYSSYPTNRLDPNFEFTDIPYQMKIADIDMRLKLKEKYIEKNKVFFNIEISNIRIEIPSEFDVFLNIKFEENCFNNIHQNVIKNYSDDSDLLNKLKKNDDFLIKIYIDTVKIDCGLFLVTAWWIACKRILESETNKYSLINKHKNKNYHIFSIKNSITYDQSRTDVCELWDIEFIIQYCIAYLETQ